MGFKIKVSGSWVSPSAISTKVSGTWQSAKNVYQKVSGTWLIVWTAMTATCPIFTSFSGSAVRSVTVTGNTGTATVTSVVLVPEVGSDPGSSFTGLSVTVGNPGVESSGSVVITVTDSIGATAIATTSYSFIGEIE